MPITLAALAEGLITERAARDVVTATCHVSATDRARIDERMRREYRRPGLGHRYLAGAARALADAADPAAAVERNRRAEGTRRCTVRPGADHMTFFTAVGTPAANLTLLTTLRRAATDQLRADPSDERTEDQAMYDVLFARVTGAELVTDPIPVTVELVMDEAALLREGTSSARVWCEGIDGGPVPAQQARELVLEAAERSRPGSGGCTADQEPTSWSRWMRRPACSHRPWPGTSGAVTSGAPPRGARRRSGTSTTSPRGRAEGGRASRTVRVCAARATTPRTCPASPPPATTGADVSDHEDGAPVPERTTPGPRAPHLALDATPTPTARRRRAVHDGYVPVGGVHG